MTWPNIYSQCLFLSQTDWGTRTTEWKTQAREFMLATFGQNCSTVLSLGTDFSKWQKLKNFGCRLISTRVQYKNQLGHICNGYATKFIALCLIISYSFKKKFLVKTLKTTCTCEISQDLKQHVCPMLVRLPWQAPYTAGTRGTGTQLFWKSFGMTCIKSLDNVLSCCDTWILLHRICLKEW